jgi:hypothetical protein
MNAVTDITADAECGRAGTPIAPHIYTLRRSGHKAVRFTGWQVVEALGAGEPGTIWYDLSMYRSEADAVIVELTARRHLVDEQDLARVEAFPSLADAASWLENYDVGNDVPIPAALSCDEGPVAVAVLKVIKLRQRIARIQDDYHNLLSDVFNILDITDTPSIQAGADLALANGGEGEKEEVLF